MGTPIITVSGTSGAGKTFFVEKIVERYPQIREIAGITTRPMREGEIQGKSSHFITLEEFKQLQKSDQLMLIKEFFGNQYAWLKQDLTNGDELRIMNISYKSIDELRREGLDIFSIFIRPESEEKLKEKLRGRTKTEEDYLKRIKDYYESEKFLAESPQTFDLIFTNSYDERSSQELLELIESGYFHRGEQGDATISADIQRLIAEDRSLDHKIALAKGLASRCNVKAKGEQSDG